MSGAVPFCHFRGAQSSQETMTGIVGVHDAGLRASKEKPTCGLCISLQDTNHAAESGNYYEAEMSTSSHRTKQPNYVFNIIIIIKASWAPF